MIQSACDFSKHVPLLRVIACQCIFVVSAILGRLDKTRLGFNHERP